MSKIAIGIKSTVYPDTKTPLNEVFLNAKKQLDNLYLSGLPKHKQPNRFHLNRIRE